MAVRQLDGQLTLQPPIPIAILRNLFGLFAVSNVPSPSNQFTIPLRVAFTVFGIGLLALLATAATLTPSPKGMGTHQQLGLPPCSIVQIFGVRCPSCGMTTAWAHTMRLQLVQAAKANTSGMLLAIVSVFCGPWLLASGLKGSWCWVLPKDWVVIVITLSLIATMIVEWCVRFFVQPI